ncbi:5-phosphohydroxy-L-lysine phospho-lyase-like isoform X1 [Haliotis rubra]|uniref:5-phosphohydroxy-L-lysine phospho-lyase-like isoform X1 n=1 Tax=Haliotis rubra TaxID=36100 RepID=UPI001EE51DE8|nr:5-phosphohydroxy-L-lysine phospho-lyase-like isoform X1 [Haliotis rubra]
MAVSRPDFPSGCCSTQNRGGPVRDRYLSHVRSCKLHFEVSPLKIVRASRQYLYDDAGNEFLDCINNVSHVGHCHPHVVSVGQEQMSKLTTSAGFLNDQMSEYAKRLISTFPEKLCVCFFLNSGSEANDLALRLARCYTKNEDVLCLDRAYHGNLANLLDISPSRFKTTGHKQRDYVHIAPCPDMYRGKYRDNTPNPEVAYADEILKLLQKAKAKGRKIGAFICEPLMGAAGVIVFPKNYLKLAYSYVREAGGVCIADEVQCGLGRNGEHLWAFQSQDVVPDIVTIGKPVGNGHPMSVVVTSKEIADSLGEFSSTFGGNPVACATGMAVLDVIQNEKLISSAQSVGKCLLEGFSAILPNHPMMGCVRGMGMLVGVEIVMDKESRKPAKEAAEILAYQMKEQRILIANDGEDQNVIVLTPPMCFTCDNARQVIQVFDKALRDIETGAVSVGLTQGGDNFTIAPPLDVPLQVLSETHGLSDEDDDSDDPALKRPRYEEMD